MEALTLDELDRESEAFDRHVAASAELDRFCSSSDWALPAARALMPGREPWLRRGRAGYAAFMRSAAGGWPGVTVLEPLEAMWMLGCPLVGADVRALAAELVEETGRERVLLVVSGLE